MIYTLASIFDIGVSIEQALRSLAGFLIAYLYDFIIAIYNIFEILAIRDFMDTDFVNQIYTKVGLILGLFMVFKLSFVLVQSLIDPSKLSDKKNGIGSIIGRVITSIVLLGITPTIFKEAFRLQNLLIGSNGSDNIIYKIIIGNSVSNKENFGTTLAKDLFFEFYTDNKDPKYDGGVTMVSSIQTSEGKNVDYGTYIKFNDFHSIMDEVSNNNSFDSTSYYLSLTDSYGRYYIEFNILGSLTAGLVIAWILLSFCIQIAIRVFKLAFLQLVAPIPILSYISDPDGSFKKWLQQCGTTFLDLFIRLMIIYFVIYFSKSVLQQVEAYVSEGIFGKNDSVWVKVFLVIGLLNFAKRVPELLKDIFPGNGKFDLGFKDLKPAATLGFGLVGGAVAGAASGIKHGEGVRGTIAGAAGGIFRGAFGSAKTKGNVLKNIGSGLNNVRAANQRAYQRHHDSSTFFGRMAPEHAQRTVDDYERELNSYTQYDSIVTIVEKEIEKDSTVQAAIAEKEKLLKYIGKTIYDPRTRSRRTITASDIKAADDNIKAVKETVLSDEMDKIRRKDPKANGTLKVALDGAEKLRAEGVKKGYAGYGKKEVTYDAHEFNENKKSTKTETGNIKNYGGTRNPDYETAKANAAYNKKSK